MRSIISVSYTHLDVYKRQKFNNEHKYVIHYITYICIFGVFFNNCLLPTLFNDEMWRDNLHRSKCMIETLLDFKSKNKRIKYLYFLARGSAKKEKCRKN